MSFFDKIKQQNDDELYFNYVEKARKTKEYRVNEQKINVIRKVLLNHSNVPQELVDKLIEHIQENVAIEYETLKCEFK